MPSSDYPEAIPRERAVAALDLANAVLDYEDDAEPADPEGSHEVVVEAETWKRWVELARAAAAVKDGGTSDGE